MNSDQDDDAFTSSTPTGRITTIGNYLASLPYDVKRRTASFLSFTDAMSMSHTCHRLGSRMRLSLLEPIPLFEDVEIHGCAPLEDKPRQGHFIPLVFPRLVHSVAVTMHWHDQGWGNRKGKIYVVGSSTSSTARTSNIPAASSRVANNSQNAESSVTTESPWKGGRLVYESPIAPRGNDSLDICFTPRQGERYYLWYVAGGGGGHRLRLIQARVAIVVYDTNDGSIGDNYRALLMAGLLHPIPPMAYYPLGLPFTAWRRGDALPWGTWPKPVSDLLSKYKLFLTLCRLLRNQLIAFNDDATRLDEGLVAWMTEHSIRCTDASLRHVEELLLHTMNEVEYHTTQHALEESRIQNEPEPEVEEEEEEVHD